MMSTTDHDALLQSVDSLGRRRQYTCAVTTEDKMGSLWKIDIYFAVVETGKSQVLAGPV